LPPVQFASGILCTKCVSTSDAAVVTFRLMIKVIAVLAAAAAFSLQAQPAPQLVRDINTTRRDSSWPGGFVSDGRLSWFFASDENGRELWSTDGTPQGTRMVRDIAAGPISSITEPNQRMVVSGDYVYFWASDDGSYAINLWRSDGTTIGTIRITNLGNENQSPGAVAAIGTHGAIFTDRSAAGLYVTDGSREGTALVADGFNSLEFDHMVGTRGVVYFAGEGELWRTDGTAAGTRRVAQIGSFGYIEQMIELNGTLFLVVSGDSFEGSYYEIWRSDGTANGTESFATFKTQLPRLQAAGGSLYIIGPSADLESTEIWKSDGTASGTRKAVAVPGFFQAGFTLVAATDDLLFFSVYESLAVQRSVVWRSDGTAIGTWSVGIFDSTSLIAAATHDALFISEGYGEAGLWRTTGAAVAMEKISPAFFEELAAHGNRIVGSAADNDHGRELWTSDGTAAGTNLLKNIFADGSSWGWQLQKLGKDHILFSALDDPDGVEPWITDGTTSGTHLVADMNPGPDSSFPVNFSDLGNGKAVFRAEEPSHGRELWVTDGSAAGTGLVRDIAKGKRDAFGEYFTPGDFPVVGGRALFFAFGIDGVVFGDGLWSSDGTESGTRRVEWPGPLYGSDAIVAGNAAYVGTTAGYLKTNGTDEGTIRLAENGITLAAAGSKVFFAGTGFGHSNELWVTDGTPTGTRLVKNIRPPSPNEYVDVFPYEAAAAAGDALFFFADDGIHGTELWRSDGTEAGTALVKDIAPGMASSFVRIVEGSAMTEFHGLLYFVADDGVHGAELWRSDGTAQGTYMASDINRDGPASFPASLTVMFDRLYFSADDGVHGRELWSTDGATTALVYDLNPGPDSSAPRDFMALPSSIVFFATRNDVGRELWKLDAPPSRHRAIR
jgi:ELWxxDGT repeat protein